MNRLAVASLVAFACVSQAPAIVIRHDREDTRYKALGERYKAPVAVLTLGGQGTLVHPKWIATAAHVAEGMTPFTYANIGGRHVRVKSAYVHPSWSQKGRSRSDIALLELEVPVTSVKPVKLYARQDELGKRIIFVGEGDTGNGNTGPTGRDGAWRAAENTVSEVNPSSIRFVFDRPPAGDDLEGISGPGDSGGPALLEERGELFLVGTSGSNFRAEGSGPCTYGTVESYGRVSTNLKWLKDVMAGKVKPLPLGKVKSLSSGWPSSPAVAPAKAFLEAYNSGNPETVVDVIEKFATEQQIRAVSREARIETTTKRYADHGQITPLATSEEAGRLIVVTRASKSGRHFLLDLSPAANGKHRIALRELPDVPLRLPK
ncbi:MAG TPA: trypsin-like serine protease [Fimbriimonadaceae bacterium]|nr:trypsin-like serine protease [Fimbriimonadaceae bacterium]